MPPPIIVFEFPILTDVVFTLGLFVLLPLVGGLIVEPLLLIMLLFIIELICMVLFIPLFDPFEIIEAPFLWRLMAVLGYPLLLLVLVLAEFVWYSMLFIIF